MITIQGSTYMGKKKEERTRERRILGGAFSKISFHFSRCCRLPVYDAHAVFHLTLRILNREFETMSRLYVRQIILHDHDDFFLLIRYLYICIYILDYILLSASPPPHRVILFYFVSFTIVSGVLDLSS